MTDRTRRPSAGTATKLFVTGASVAAGMGLIGLIDAAAAGAGSSSLEAENPSVRMIRRVVVTTEAPDLLLQSTMGESRIVIQEAPAPIIRTRSASARVRAQSKSSGS